MPHTLQLRLRKNSIAMKKETIRTRKFILIGGLTLSSLLILVAIVGAMTGSALSAQQPEGGPTWDTVFTETFESGIGAGWDVSDGNLADGEHYWATTTFTASQGTMSAWATGGGADGASLTAGTDDYPNNATSYMVRDSVSLSGTTRAQLTFDYLVNTEADFDLLQVAASTDGSTYQTLETFSGDSQGWQTTTLELDEFAGEENVWIRFFFSSNGVVTDRGVFVDNIIFETLTTQQTYLPFVRKDPTPTPTNTPTPTPTPTTPPYHYFDDFSDSNSGWPVVDHTWDSQDCFRWYYEDENYKANICDDRTDVKVSPLVPLPTGDYSLDVDAHFRYTGGNWWWTSYGILFDAKDEPNPNRPDLGDYYMIWVLWEGDGVHKWKILKDVPGDQEDVTSWETLPSSIYNYGSNGSDWNHWRIERSATRIRVLVNGHQIANVAEPRPTTNNQILFGVFASTYETSVSRVGFDNVLVDYINGPSAPWTGTPQPFYQSGDGANLIPFLPPREN